MGKYKRKKRDPMGKKEDPKKVSPSEDIQNIFEDERVESILNDPTSPYWGIGSGSWCPDCGGLCGNSEHNRRW